MKILACLLLAGCASVPLEDLEDAALYCTTNCIMANQVLEKRLRAIERRKANEPPDCGPRMFAYREQRGGSFSPWVCVRKSELNGIFN